jgi:outer membrane receptor protein involved in Fe transport
MKLKQSFVLFCLFTLLSSLCALAQTITTGELAGTVTDPSGAVVAGASVQLKSVDEGSVSNTKTSSTGYYQFAYLRPGSYSVTVIGSGFQGEQRNVSVALGASATANFKLTLGSSTTTVEVSGAAAEIETEDANITANFGTKQLEQLPNPGNDLSAVALTAPGVVMNTGGGAMFGGGNFEVNGLPATSNLFTLDGSNDNDPYFNVNNTGATNLSLGLNDIQESTVVSNGYSGAYGGLAGANVNYVTKSGSNAFHGNAIYWWNGNILNANNYFRNQSNGLAGSDVDPRPFVNDNQFAGSIGGPIKKDKAFFFFDVEGLQLAIPSPQSLTVPTPAFQSAVLANLASTSSGLSASVPFYNQIFGLYNRVSQAGAKQLGPGVDPATITAQNPNGIPNGGGCSDISPSTQSAFAAFSSAPCAVAVQAALSAHTHDRLFAWKFDMNLTHNDKLFVRVEKEHGVQATYTDGIDPAFNVVSDQPQWQAQFGETHTFGSDKVNDFKASMLWYSAGFAMQNQSAASSALTVPGVGAGTETFALGDGSLSALNADNVVMPQGRNIFQHQYVDDFSWIRGRNNFKVGVNFRRDDISDQNFVFVTPEVLAFSLANFATGGVGGQGDIIVQNFPSRTEVPIALYQLGLYAADDLKVSNNLKLTLSLRADHLSNPICQINCFQRFAPGAFGDSTAAPNTAILTGEHQAFPSVTNISWQPKIGFAWTPGGSQKTVLRGGIGIFADALPTGAIDSFLQNAPLDPQFITPGGYISPAETNPTQLPGTLYALSAASGASFAANYASGAPGCAVPGANQAACVPAFSFTNATAVKVPTYYKWSLEVQQAVGWHTTLNLSYVGNHGSHEEFSNQALNAWCCAAGQLPNAPTATSFANLPTTVPDARFGAVAQANNIANSNYDGLMATVNHSFNGGLQFQASYTWSHALDEISNNSLSPFGLNTAGLYADIIYPQNPSNPQQNYGNADYDVRQNFVMNYVWSDAFRHLTHWGPNALMKGWAFSGTLFAHTGLPFTAYSSAVTDALENTNYGPGGGAQTIFANQNGPAVSCGSSAATVTPQGLAAAPCLSASNFSTPTTTFGNERRNQNVGPFYFDTDFAVEKAFGISRWEGSQFSVGARFFNLFNHPDFYFPVMNVNSPQFGQIIQTVSTPTSIYGSGLGADASPRVIQLQAKFTF